GERRDLHSFPTRRSSDLIFAVLNQLANLNGLKGQLINLASILRRTYPWAATMCVCVCVSVCVIVCVCVKRRMRGHCSSQPGTSSIIGISVCCNYCVKEMR